MAGIGLAGFSLAAPASAEETVGSPAEWRLPLQRHHSCPWWHPAPTKPS